MKRQINIVSIAIALIAMLFFEYGIWQLSFLTNVHIADAVRSTGRAGSPQFSAAEIINYAVVINAAHFAGFFIAGVLSFILSERKRADLYESLIAFVVFWSLGWLGVTNLKYFSIIARLPGSS